MTELIYHTTITTDGFIADQNRVADDSIFLYNFDDGGDFFNSVKQYDMLLMGRKTYEYGFQYGLKPGEPSGIAPINPNLKHYIFSRSMDFESNEQVELIKSDAADFVKELKQHSPDQKIWLWGGGELAGTLLDQELIDTIILKIHPVMIGQGIPLFGSSNKRIKLNLTDLKKYDSGVILSKYAINY